jgi:hypothetical protein
VADIVIAKIYQSLDADGHAGIIFGAQESNSLGDWVKALELICFVYTADEMVNHVEYI